MAMMAHPDNRFVTHLCIISSNENIDFQQLLLKKVAFNSAA
jgi:hypothetical protein